MTSDLIRLDGRVVAAGPPGARLIDWLRETAGVVVPKEACGAGHCGACTTLVDGLPVAACCTLVHAVIGRSVNTAAELRRTEVGRMVLDKFQEHGAIQCGFCGPGMAVAGTAWLAGIGDRIPDRAEAAAALAGNLCRCSGYAPIVDALLDAAASRIGASS